MQRSTVKKLKNQKSPLLDVSNMTPAQLVRHVRLLEEALMELGLEVNIWRQMQEKKLSTKLLRFWRRTVINRCWIPLKNKVGLGRMSRNKEKR